MRGAKLFEELLLFELFFLELLLLLLLLTGYWGLICKNEAAD